jgi:hypothetical protein
VSEEICSLCVQYGKSIYEKPCNRCQCYAGEFVPSPKAEAIGGMYEALKAVAPFVEHLAGRALGPADIDSTELLKQIRDALKKAEGGEG